MKKFILSTLFCIGYLWIQAQPSLTFLSHHPLTPNNEDTIGVFCRVFYHPIREKFYTVYAGRDTTSNDPQGQMGYFAWREYDTNFVFTGVHDSLSNHVSAGDFAMVQVGTDYYHLTSGPPGKYKLSKYNEDFVLDHDTLITLDSHDSNTDQLMNYTNGRLVIGAFHEQSQTYPSFPMQNSWTPVMHKLEFDLNLNMVTVDTHLTETFYSWGGSCIFNPLNNTYNIVTLDSFPLYNLNSYHYDANWNYLGYTNLNSDGQWSQGVLWDGTYYYVSYHSGNEHRAGNIVIAIYDVNWNQVYTTTITNHLPFPMPNGTQDTSAQRPFLLRVGNKLYVSYDEQSYQFISGGFFDLHFDWQSHVQVFQINGLSGIEGETTNKFQLYPNPAKSFVSFYIDELPDDNILRIYNSLGEMCKTTAIIKGNNTLSLDDLPNGIYYLQYENDQTVYTAKLIKNN